VRSATVIVIVTVCVLVACRTLRPATDMSSKKRKNILGTLCQCFSMSSLSRRLRLKCDGTGVETRFRLSAKRTSQFKSEEASVQSTTGSRDLRISGSNAGYAMFRGSVKSTGYPLHSPVSPSLPHPQRHRVPSHFNWTLTFARTGQSRLPPGTENISHLVSVLCQVTFSYNLYFPFI
jgi:hypothetical protein